MKPKRKAGISLIIILACLCYLGYQFRDKLEIEEFFEKVPFLKSEEVSDEPLESIKWLTFVHGTLHYSIKYPDTFLVEKKEDGQVVHFFDQGRPVVKVRVVSIEERAKKGLWLTSNPVEPATLAGQSCKKYTSKEKDGSELVKVLSYVVPAEGKLVGVEFRTGDGSLSSVQKEVLNSFQFDAEIAASPPR